MKPYGSKKCYALEDSMTRKSFEAQFFNLRISDKQRRTLKRRARASAKMLIKKAIQSVNYEA